MLQKLQAFLLLLYFQSCIIYNYDMMYNKIAQALLSNPDMKEIDFDHYENNISIIKLIDFKGPHCKKIEITDKDTGQLIDVITDLETLRDVAYRGVVGKRRFLNAGYKQNVD